MNSRLNRREALGAAATLMAMHSTPNAERRTPGAAQPSPSPNLSLKGEEPAAERRLKQSVCRWCFPKMTLEQLCMAAKGIGIQGIDLLSENEWQTANQLGLTCAMANGPSGITDGWNRPQDHDKLVKESERLLSLAKAAGVPNVIVFSGNRRGISDADGMANCLAGIKRIVPLAESLGITLAMELLNSKRMHKDYQCDHTAWGVELCKRVGSDRFKLLYDIFHMQTMEGDICDTIRENIAYIAHFHTGGVPGRHELDDTQELNYRRIATAIADSGFKGFVAHEFLPTRDPIVSLHEAYRVCDV